MKFSYKKKKTHQNVEMLFWTMLATFKWMFFFHKKKKSDTAVQSRLFQDFGVFEFWGCNTMPSLVRNWVPFDIRLLWLVFWTYILQFTISMDNICIVFLYVHFQKQIDITFCFFGPPPLFFLVDQTVCAHVHWFLGKLN